MIARNAALFVLVVAFLAGGFVGFSLYTGLHPAAGESGVLEVEKTSERPQPEARSDAPVDLSDLPNIGDLGVQLSGDSAAQPATDQVPGGDMFGTLMRTLMKSMNLPEDEKLNETLGYRIFVVKFRDKLAADGHPLTPGQEERLIALMQEEDAKMFPFDAIANNEDLDDIDLSAGALVGRMRDRDQRVAKRAGEFLSEAQVHALVAVQEQARRTMMSLGSSTGQSAGQDMLQKLLQGATE